MPAVIANRETQRLDKPAAKPSYFEAALSHKSAPYFVTALFVTALLIWTALDHSLPIHDAAWHSSYSNAVKTWLTHPRNWNLQSLTALLTMQPNYPAGIWFFNGFCKLFLGDTLWSEHAILAVHLCILNASTWTLVNLLSKDRLKATLSIMLLDCCPLILALQHVSFMDLPSTAFFASFLCGLVWWKQNMSWKRTFLAGVLFGAFCVSKQIAILYAAPCLAAYAAILLYKRQFKGIAQMAVITVIGAAFLSSWVIPNYHEIANYSHLRSSMAAERIGFFAGVWRNMQAAAVQIFQSFSPLMVALLLLSSKFIRKEDLKQVWPVILSPVAGALLMLITAFFNYPEPRYFCAVMLPLSIVLAAAFAQASRSSKLGTNCAIAGVILASVQALILSFQSAPAVPSEAFTNPNPVFTGLGINDAFLRTKIPYYPAGDPWKQTWMFKYIEDIERGRLVYLNVLSNSFEYNQGTLVCLSRMRHSPVCPTTWRTCMPDQTDSFNYTEQDLHSMQWVLLQKNGASTRWYDQHSKEKYDEVVNTLESGEQFIEAAKQPLPDKSELVLYRNKYWMFTRPGEKPDPRLSASSTKQTSGVQ